MLAPSWQRGGELRICKGPSISYDGQKIRVDSRLACAVWKSSQSITVSSANLDSSVDQRPRSAILHTREVASSLVLLEQLLQRYCRVFDARLNLG